MYRTFIRVSTNNSSLSHCRDSKATRIGSMCNPSIKGKIRISRRNIFYSIHNLMAILYRADNSLAALSSSRSPIHSPIHPNSSKLIHRAQSNMLILATQTIQLVALRISMVFHSQMRIAKGLRFSLATMA
jgi:methenyltetrahydromethanopterin cyclohydrolase